MNTNKLLTFILILFLLNSFFVSAQLDGLQEGVDNLDKNLEGARDLAEDPETTASNYLKQEWTKIFEKNKFGRIILAMGNVLNSLNPVFLLVIGVEYSLSWYFIFAFLIWLAFFIFFFQLGRGIFPEKKIIVIPLAFIITSLIGISGAIVQVTDLASEIVNDPLSIAIAFIISLIVLALIVKFTWQIAIFLRKTKEKWEKLKLKGDTKLIGATAEGLRKGFKNK